MGVRLAVGWMVCSPVLSLFIFPSLLLSPLPIPLLLSLRSRFCGSFISCMLAFTFDSVPDVSSPAAEAKNRMIHVSVMAVASIFPFHPLHSLRQAQYGTQDTFIEPTGSITVVDPCIPAVLWHTDCFPSNRKKYGMHGDPHSSPSHVKHTFRIRSKKRHSSSKLALWFLSMSYAFSCFPSFLFERSTSAHLVL